MNISSGLNTVSSLYGQQKSNYMKAPASAEKTFYDLRVKRYSSKDTV